MRPILAGLLLGGAFAAANNPALGHHSFAMFDLEHLVELEGIVKEFRYSAPHGWQRSFETTSDLNGVGDARRLRSGLQLLHAVRSNEQVRDLRFILMSADANPDLGAFVRRCGANGFLRKPFSADALREAIESAFGAPD
jgi:DNA-binding NtrC family response regulator